MSTTIRQTVTFDATPHAVFEALLDPKKHAAFTGAKASISRKVGGKMSAWDGYIEGKNLRIEKDKVIVQSWRTTEFEEGDPDSQVMFRFSRKGKGTRLSFVHSKVPDRLAESFRQGWIDNYWVPLKAYLETPTA
ncbi:MAG TPA: SRPBCC domain-containing protein [Thermoplasmata archaeon]|nr:SRPBCC domain-containing protein [Thermoplasmata archaeon]